MNSSERRASSGMSSKSLRLRAGSMTRRIPAPWAATTFSLMPPTGSTSPRKLISHRAAGEQRHKRHEHRNAGAWAILRGGAGRHVNMDVGLLETGDIDTEGHAPVLDDRERRLG